MTDYTVRQSDWLREHNVKIGDLVLVARKAESLEFGWDNVWNPSMDTTVGCVGKITEVKDRYGIWIKFDAPIGSAWLFPYTALASVKYICSSLKEPAPEPEIEPGTIVLVRDSLTESWKMDVFVEDNSDRLYKHVCKTNCWKYCIPYAGHEALFATNLE